MKSGEISASAEPPMTLANMRENGVRSTAAWCGNRFCGHQSVFNADYLPADVTIPSIGPKLRCSVCGHLGADARPDWSELKR
jgi:hypothetical protein